MIGMSTRPIFFALLIAVFGGMAFAAEPPPSKEWIAAGEKRRDEIPFGGDFKPTAKVPVFVALGHGARVIVSKDDGKTWTQTFFGYPGEDHGGWASGSLGYTNGLFAFSVGWTDPTSYLASDDCLHWRHLTDGKTALRNKERPDLMPTASNIAGGKGVFVACGYVAFTATPDFGKTWTSFNVPDHYKKDPRGPLNTHHVRVIYCGDSSGRFLALGDNRGKEGPTWGHLFASDDMGKTWKWLAPSGLDQAKGRGAIASNGQIVLMTDPSGENVYRSTDGGNTWDGPHPTGVKRATLSVVKGEFWLIIEPTKNKADFPRASADGLTWRNLPKSIPAGKIAISDKGTLINTNGNRFNILRSSDNGETWQEVYSYKPDADHVQPSSQGLRDVAFGYTNGE